MMLPELPDQDLSDVLDDLQMREEPFAIATIIRTAGATAAKPGAKALLRADGTILHGWLGGGCIRKALRDAALKALREGAPQLVSLAPEDVLTEKGLTSGDVVDGVRYDRNGCPSKGSIDIFVEPCLPRPELVIFGASPVARALADLAPRFEWAANSCEATRALDAAPTRRRVIVIATQGQGDLAALQTALANPADYVAFVGSRKKYAALAKRLSAQGIAQDLIDAVHAPAGLDIGAVTPDEIALSILAQLTKVRRQALCGARSDR